MHTLQSSVIICVILTVWRPHRSCRQPQSCAGRAACLGLTPGCNLCPAWPRTWRYPPHPTKRKIWRTQMLNWPKYGLLLLHILFSLITNIVMLTNVLESGKENSWTTPSYTDTYSITSSVARGTGERLVLRENFIPRYKHLKIPNFFDQKNNCHKSIQLSVIFYSNESGIFFYNWQTKCTQN